MALEAGVSFRVPRPSPVIAPGGNAVAFPLLLSVESPNRRYLERLCSVLGSQPEVRGLGPLPGPLKGVQWTMDMDRALRLPNSLRPFPVLAAQAREGVRAYTRGNAWTLPGRKGRVHRWRGRTQVMGVLNVTPDSFSDGGRFLGAGAAVERALQLQEEGADWIDIGGESTKPGAVAVSAAEEKKRVLPVVRACARALRVPISVDTYKASVAEAAVGEGAGMVNDIGALRLDQRMGPTLGRLGVPVILMHMRGRPRTMQKGPRYRDLVADLVLFFRERLERARECGIRTERVLLDPGFGFGKTPRHNLDLVRRLWEFRVLGRPLVMGPSRKSTLGLLLGGAPPEDRLEATAAAVTASILNGADFVRVHDVKVIRRVVKIADAIRYDRGPTEP